MFNRSFLFLRSIILPLFLVSFLLTGCKEEVTSPEEYDSDQVVLQQMVLEDSSNSSFEAAFNDGDPMGYFSKELTNVYPIRIGRRITTASRTINSTFLSDTAYVTATYNFTGNFFLVASHDSAAVGDTTAIDTTIVKPFSSVVVRKLIFAKVANTRNPRLNWRLVAVSLPDGGTVTNNLKINKLSVYLPNGDSIIVTSPSDYYLNKFPGMRRQIPVISRNQAVTVKLEVFSAYDVDDLVVLTFGADPLGRNRQKVRFSLVSSEPATGGYNKVYEHTFRPTQAAGYYHALMDVMSNGSIFTDNQPFENKMWGMPYIVR